jgi:hypothetical protein
MVDYRAVVSEGAIERVFFLLENSAVFQLKKRLALSLLQM